jgi:hypothetical protein
MRTSVCRGRIHCSIAWGRHFRTTKKFPAVSAQPFAPSDAVPLRQCALPISDRLAIDEIAFHFITAWMMRRELDAELSHATTTDSFAVQLHRKFEVALKRCTLLGPA